MFTKKLKSGSVSAIVPAFNEGKYIGRVLEVLATPRLLGEVIVVDDGSTDRTSAIVKETFPTVRVLSHQKNRGKADALLTGAKAAKNPTLLFCDADLTNLKVSHVQELIGPVLTGKLRMVVGVQENMNVWREMPWYRKIFPAKKPEKPEEISDFIKTLGGEKVLSKKDFLAVPGIAKSDYGVEQKVVAFFRRNGWSFDYHVLKGVGHVWKGQKWGLKGLFKEAKAFATFGWEGLKNFLLERIS